MWLRCFLLFFYFFSRTPVVGHALFFCFLAVGETGDPRHPAENLHFYVYLLVRLFLSTHACGFRQAHTRV